MSKTLRSQMNPTTLRSTAPTIERDPDRLLDQRVEVVGVHDQDDRGECRTGSPPRIHGGQAALGRERPDLAPDPLALGDRVGDGVEELGEVPADLPLDPHRHDHPREVGALHAGRDVVERVLDRSTEPVLVERELELRRSSGSAASCATAPTACTSENPARSEPREQLERVGQRLARTPCRRLLALAAPRRTSERCDDRGRDDDREPEAAEQQTEDRAR